MTAELLVILVLPALLATAAGWDLANYTIPNLLQIALIAAFLAFALAAGLSPSSIGFHLLAGLAGLAIGFVLFALSVIGGGDAKLLACTMLWLGFRDVLEYVFIAAILGGVFSLTLLGLRQIALPRALARRAWIARLHDPRSGVPYGVALAAGAFVVLPYTEIFRLAAAA